MERFSCSASVAAGEGALAVLRECRCSRLLVVTDPAGMQSGRAKRTAAAAQCDAVEYYDELGPEATMGQAVAGAGVVKSFGPDLVAAVGDRNVLDCARSMVCFSRHRCILAAVPTAPGSGAELTDQVLLAHNGCLHLLQDAAMRPDFVVQEAAFAAEMTKAEAAEGGFALLSAGLEAYSARNRGMIRDIHAREAFAAGWACLPAAVSGNAAARQRLLTASALAGMAWEQTGLGLCHALENSLSCLLHLPRGRLSAILLPAVIGCNAYAAGGRYAELARAAGMGGSSEGIGLRNLRTGLIRLRRELGLPGTLTQAGVPPRAVWDQVGRIVALTLEDPQCRNNPVPADDFLVRRILEEITGRL